MYTGFHLPPVSAVYDVLRRNCVSFSEGPDRTIFDLDARLGRSTVSTCGIGEGRDPGEMKASVHVVTTVCHGRGVGRPRRPCIVVCLRNPLSSRPWLQPALKEDGNRLRNRRPQLSHYWTLGTSSNRIPFFNWAKYYTKVKCLRAKRSRFQ